MDESAKYVIHARFTADGVVERSDVVGAVFGQTEGLLGDELDLRDLQQTSKIGRIDVSVDSEAGTSTGEITIASNLDRVETAILGAALETIDRVGPCTADITVDRIEDVRTAKRRQVIDRAKELLEGAFDEGPMSSEELIEEVRASARAASITEYEGLPAGPRVADSDAVIIVEGRADVLTLLEYGVKNAIAVEGTNVPDAVAELTRGRTVTAFLDGDRGGDLILRELDQVAEIDYVAIAPRDRSVEDLERHEVFAALREKVPFDAAMVEADSESEGGDDADADADAELDTTAATDGSAQPAPEAVVDPASTAEATVATDPEAITTEDATGVEPPSAAGSDPDPDSDPESEAGSEPEKPPSLADHVEAVIGGETGRARFLDAGLDSFREVTAEDAFEAIEDGDPVPDSVVLDGELTQRVLDVAAQRGVGRIVARETGEFVKRPTGVRVLRAAEYFDIG